jgi:predicted PhzF superfamily epimerase YddE/YHI9
VAIELHQVVTFATDAFGGNPAYVLVSDRRIPYPILQRLTHHLREPVIAALTAGDKSHLSFCTQSGAHPGAGHVAHAAAHIALNHLHPSADRLELALDHGRSMLVRRGDDGPQVEWPVMAYAATDAIERVRACVGVQALATFSSPFGLLAILGSSEDVAAVRPNLDAISALPENTLMITARDTVEDFAIRVFAPKVGLPEDPVCGTAHRIVVPLWAKQLNKTRLTSRHLSPRGGRLRCHLDNDTVTLGGAATPFFSGTIAADLT